MPDSATVDEIEKAFAACGCPVQIELAQLADPAIGAQLTGRGYRLAVITTQPGSKSQQNAQRQGFDLLYARAVLVKQPEPAQL